MALLKKFTETLWSYVSPSKPKDTANKTPPQTIPRIKTAARPARRGASLGEVVQRSRSMTPISRVDSWRVRNSTSQASSSKKRKTTATPSTSASRRRKVRKMRDHGMMDYDVESEEESEEEINNASSDEDGDDSGEDSDQQMDEVSSSLSAIHVRRSPSPKGYAYEDHDASEIDTSRVLSDAEYEDSTPKKKILISPTAAHFDRNVDTTALRAQGWDDDHITLVQKIAMRGFEPLMPNYWHFEYRFHLPDSLFIPAKGDDNDAIIGSVRGEHQRAIVAIEKLFELGGRVRDRVVLKGPVRPDQQVSKTMREYMKWAVRDSGLDSKTAIPLLTLVAKPATMDAEEIKAHARKKCAKLALRYRNAFRVLQSIEASPSSHTSTQLSYPTPTLYALIASHTLIALTAYNPEETEPDIKIVAMFEMKDKDYDVWNALALAIVVCHLRNVQMRIAEETGLGVKDGPRERQESVDWDA